MTKEYPLVYRESINYAFDHQEEDLWIASHSENLRCAQTLEVLEQKKCHKGEDFLNFYDELKIMIEEYGWQRMFYVTAYQCHLKDQDYQEALEEFEFAYFHHFQFPSLDLKLWQDERIDFPKEPVIPCDDEFVISLCACLHHMEQVVSPFLTDKDCQKGNKYLGQVVLLNLEALPSQYKFSEFQFAFVHYGFGCTEEMLDDTIYVTFLYNDKFIKINRSHILGIVKEKSIPVWMKERVVKLRKEHNLKSELYLCGRKFPAKVSLDFGKLKIVKKSNDFYLCVVKFNYHQIRFFLARIDQTKNEIRLSQSMIDDPKEALSLFDRLKYSTSKINNYFQTSEKLTE